MRLFPSLNETPEQRSVRFAVEHERAVRERTTQDAQTRIELHQVYLDRMAGLASRQRA